MVTTSDKKKKSKMKVSTDWYIAIEHQRSSSIKVIFVNYQTSELQFKYQSYIQVDSIGDTQGFSGNTLIEVEGTLLWETESDRSISVIEDGIPRQLYHCHLDVL